MSFTAHTVVSGGASTGTGIAAMLQKMKPTSTAQLVLTLQVKVASALGWDDKDKIAIQLGEGEHHGLLRLKKDPQGSAVMKRLHAGGNGLRGGPYFRLNLGHVELFVDRRENRRWVKFDNVDDGWIEVVLPGWADETSPNRRPRSTALTVSAPPARQTAVRDLAPHLMGDPPKERSALSQRRSGGGVAELTRGQARRRAEQAEVPELEAAEVEAWNRKARAENLLADLMQIFGLTGGEAKVVRELLDGKLKTREALHHAAYGDDPNGGPEIKIIDVFITKVRKKLKVRMVEIATVWGQGYRMDSPMVARVMVLLGDGAPTREDDEAELAAMDEQTSEQGEDA